MNFLKVYAQDNVDTLAAPTFPFDPPFDTPDSNSNLGEVIINSEKAVFEVGEKFIISIRVESGELKLDEYNIVISYDPGILKVTDSDANSAGSQVTFLDTFFSEDVNLASEQLGTIQVSGSSPDSGVTVNRNVAEIEFTTLKTGTVTLQVIENQSSLASLQTNVLGETVPLVITVTGETQEPGPVIIPPTLPKGGILDELPFLTGVLGVVLLLVGLIVGIKYRKPEKRQVNK